MGELWAVTEGRRYDAVRPGRRMLHPAALGAVQVV